MNDSKIESSESGIGGLLRSLNSTENRELRTENIFHYDSNGNVILLTDGLGRETGRYAYDAFGKTLTATGPAARMNRYRFSTKPVEEESGLVYYGYRYYDPVTGRWPSRDPIEEQGGVNLYRMVGGRPVDLIDILGLTSWTMEDCNGCEYTGLSKTKTRSDFEWMMFLASALGGNGEGGNNSNPVMITWSEKGCFCLMDCGYGRMVDDLQHWQRVGVSKSGSTPGLPVGVATLSEAAFLVLKAELALVAEDFDVLCANQCAILARDQDLNY